MMLLGFAGLGFAGFCASHKSRPVAELPLCGGVNARGGLPMAYRSRAACAALLSGVMGVMATTDAGLAASITLASSGGGVYDYDLTVNSGEAVYFLQGQTITLSGLSGVTGASVSNVLGISFTVSSVSSTSVEFAQTLAPSSGFGGPGTYGTLVVDSTAPTGTVDYSIDYSTMTTPGGGLIPATISGTVDGPVAAAVPEPATWAMALLGFAGLGFAAHRRAKLKGPVGFSAA
jgi:hypothetical protein